MLPLELRKPRANWFLEQLRSGLPRALWAGQRPAYPQTMDTPSSRTSSSPRSSAGARRGAGTCAARVVGPGLALRPDKAEAAYQRAGLRSACFSDTVYCLLSVMVGLTPAAGGGGGGGGGAAAAPAALRGGPLAAGALAALAALLAVQLAAPALYMAHRRCALVLLAAATLAGDVAWLRASAAAAAAEAAAAGAGGFGGGGGGGGGGFGGGGGGFGGGGSGGSGGGGLGGAGACVGGGGGGGGGGGSCAAPAAPAAPWGALADALLVRSGVTAACVHACVLALDFPWRAALQVAEVALIMAHTTLPLAALVGGPAYLPPLRAAHDALRAALVRALSALAALPLPLPLHAGGAGAAAAAVAAAAAAARPACLPLAAVVTAQLALGLALPLWVAFLGERSRRCAFALALRRRAAHGAAAAAPPARPLGGGGAPCCCGDAACGAGLPAGGYGVEGVPRPLLRALFLCAHALCFTVFACAVWLAAGLAADAAVGIAPAACGLPA
ncbi:MAG: hypothetical protein J3K34DRAFT_493149 [Monoraphidium minutum]|nr:MAG: hypothetical protein J3K34DRAFT_493149 [Monoraphidium minutum]